VKASGLVKTLAIVSTVLTLSGISVAPAMAQGVSGPGPGAHNGSATDALRGAFAEQTPEQRRAFCGRVAQAAVSCGTTDMAALLVCLIRTLPAQDSARAARVANATRGNVGELIHECGVTLGR
jgi:hypothetical protein